MTCVHISTLVSVPSRVKEATLKELPKLPWFWTEKTAPQMTRWYAQNSTHVKLSRRRVSREAGTQEHGIALDVHRTTELHLRPKDSVFFVKGNKME